MALNKIDCISSIKFARPKISLRVHKNSSIILMWTNSVKFFRWKLIRFINLGNEKRGKSFSVFSPPNLLRNLLNSHHLLQIETLWFLVIILLFRSCFTSSTETGNEWMNGISSSNFCGLFIMTMIIYFGQLWAIVQKNNSVWKARKLNAPHNKNNGTKKPSSLVGC